MITFDLNIKIILKNSFTSTVFAVCINCSLFHRERDFSRSGFGIFCACLIYAKFKHLSICINQWSPTSTSSQISQSSHNFSPLSMFPSESRRWCWCCSGGRTVTDKPAASSGSQLCPTERLHASEKPHPSSARSVYEEDTGHHTNLLL